ncbi:MAG: SH3 domain-containing protein [Verrucomicrobia bacterium]|nr:SH3 domain-containing protein [Verrucomicrobiota bacterium]
MLFLFLGAQLRVVADDSFREGAAAYAAADYARAAGKFREAASNAPSSATFHNLGNAEWKNGRTGAAVLAWERAQWLDPFTTNATASLRFARHTAQLESPRLAWHEGASTWLPVNAWPLLASLSAWLAVAALMLPPIFRARRRDWHQALAAASFAVFLATLPALAGVHARAKFGVVLATKTPLRLTPTREGQVITSLPAGETARLERERGGYVFIRAGNDAAGWVERERFGMICGR